VWVMPPVLVIASLRELVVVSRRRAVAAAGPGPTWIAARLERREKEIDRSPPTYRSAAAGVGGGLGFEVALRRSAERFPGRLGDELRRLVRRSTAVIRRRC
jgi:hypothetical protein